MKKGFTLIEVIIYIALFSILIGGMLVATYQLIQGANALNSKKTLQNEGNFVLRKLDWALTGLDPLNPPAISGSSCLRTITLNKIDPANNPIVITLTSVSGPIEMKRNGNPFSPLTTRNVKITCMEASIIPAIGAGPSGIVATTTINGVDFVLTKYIRK